MSNEYKYEELQLELVIQNKPKTNEDKLQELLVKMDILLEKLKKRKATKNS